MTYWYCTIAIFVTSILFYGNQLQYECEKVYTRQQFNFHEDVLNLSASSDFIFDAIKLMFAFEQETFAKSMDL